MNLFILNKLASMDGLRCIVRTSTRYRYRWCTLAPVKGLWRIAKAVCLYSWRSLETSVSSPLNSKDSVMCGVHLLIN